MQDHPTSSTNSHLRITYLTVHSRHLATVLLLQVHSDAPILLDQWDDFHVEVRHHADHVAQCARQAPRLRSKTLW